MSAYSHPVGSVYANMYADVHNTYLTHTPAHAWCPQHMSKCMHTLSNARLCNSTEASVPWKVMRNYLESCASIVQTVVCRLPVLLSRRIRSPDAVCSRNPSNSALGHDAIAAAVSHKHHSIICVGAGLVEFVFGSHSKRAPVHPSQRSIFTIFFAGFL